MDEILIEEKRYVSSKQAAKVTGYAKDYIGQLCREGRVPARLVGRSWYVLESAIHDHRFGNPKSEPIEAVETTSEEHQPSSTWQSPRYEATEDPILPSVESLKPVDEVAGDESEVAQRIQETWKAWFDRFDTVASTDPVESREEDLAVDEPVAPKEVETETEEEIEVPIRAIHHQSYHPAPREFLPDIRHSVLDMDETEPLADELPVQRSKGRGRGLLLTMQAAGAVVAMVAVSLAVLGSGYLDTYIISNSQVGLVAGVGLYNR